MKTISRFLFFAILLFFNSAFADIASDAEQLFNWGEQKYPKYFTTGETKIVTQVLDYRGYKWYYRYYPQTKIYLATNKLNKVYVLGGVFGNNLLYVGTIQDLLNQSADVTPPVITLSGNNPVTVNQGSNYTDAGATATDDVDGSIEVTTSGSVDTSKVGTYTITYMATDKAGNQATATRTVNVVGDETLTTKVSKNFINGKYIVDLDSDGDLDVLETSRWNENDGNSNFITHPLPFTASLVFAADMDNDGDIDIVSRYGTEITLYKNNGYQEFSKYVAMNREYGFGYDSNGIYLADMDSDGDMDVIAAWMSQDWYENNGDGNFTKHRMGGRGGKDIIAEDVDSDGDMDYIESDNNVIWHENNGNQSFTSHRLSATDIGGASSYAIDIDKDGDIDIISTRRWKQGIDLYENDGNQNFTTIIVSNNKYSSYTYATDIDRDGYIDILNGTTWFKNDGSNNFTKQPSITLDNAKLITLVNSEPETDKIIHNGVTYGIVTSPHTGRVWLDRNLGASQVCQSFDDEQCYGDYYQWGRLNDGHQFSTSEISSTSASNITNAGTDFILAQVVDPELAGYDMDWVSIPDEDPYHIAELRIINWSKIDGTGICPVGYRVPIVEELKNEINVEFLKVPLAGYRSGYNGDISFQGREWKIWSSSVEEQGPGSQILMFDKDAPSENLKISFTIRSDGLSIRCIKD